ncbi:MAG TPA: isocitrate lyase [Thermoplasmata archaeon]|nr:isocitrate lyase [Thermoplasmata archaeon]
MEPVVTPAPVYGSSARDLPDRWIGIERPYRREDVRRLAGSVRIEQTLAERGARRFWSLLQSEPFLPALGAMSGTQAVQMVQAGLQAIYVSGWQVAADANTAGQTYPEMSLYPVDSVPHLVRRINNAFRREDEKQTALGETGLDWYAPIIADAEAGFGGVLNVFELTRSLIEAGAAAIHLEDQLSSVKKCGHLGGKVLVPAREFNQKLWAARLAADVLDVPMVLVARTDALSAALITSDIDPRDQPFLTGKRTPEGFYAFKGGIDAAIARGLACAPYADLLWFESSRPDLDEASHFAQEIHARHPGKRLAYNCSPSFNWRRHLSARAIDRFQSDLGDMGYRFLFVTLAAYHATNLALFQLAQGYSARGMAAYSELQDREFEAEPQGYRAVKHQGFVGTAYFDDVAEVLSGGLISTLAMAGSTETSQFTRASLKERSLPAVTTRARGRRAA